MDRSSKRPCAAGRDTFLPTALRQTACPVNSGVTRITGRSGLSRDSAHHIGHAPPAGACKANATTAQRRDGKSSVHRSAPVARSGFRRCSKGGVKIWLSGPCGAGAASAPIPDLPGYGTPRRGKRRIWPREISPSKPLLVAHHSARPASFQVSPLAASSTASFYTKYFMAPHDQPLGARRHGARAGAEHALGRSLPRLHVGRRACWTGVVRAPGGSCRATHGDQAPLGLDSLWVGAVQRCRRVV